jgi:hypothetical protein
MWARTLCTGQLRGRRVQPNPMNLVTRQSHLCCACRAGDVRLGQATSRAAKVFEADRAIRGWPHRPRRDLVAVPPRGCFHELGRWRSFRRLSRAPRMFATTVYPQLLTLSYGAGIVIRAPMHNSLPGKAHRHDDCLDHLTRDACVAFPRASRPRQPLKVGPNHPRSECNRQAIC